MTATQDKLRKIAREILSLNELDLMALLPEYQKRMDNFNTIQEWEEAVILYFLINGCRIKNIQFCEKVNQLNSNPKRTGNKADDCARPRPELSLVPPPGAAKP
ncbi:MAG: hypothetical protein LBQ12_16065 [Deltaproteobacteria bacterium]|jgi:hypothetical protein|nr:hypothetical protein [Deltaproteobacteria bacterium]